MTWLDVFDLAVLVGLFGTAASLLAWPLLKTAVRPTGVSEPQPRPLLDQVDFTACSHAGRALDLACAGKVDHYVARLPFDDASRLTLRSETGLVWYYTHNGARCPLWLEAELERLHRVWRWRQ